MEISTEFNLLSKITNARSLTGEDALTNKIAIELKALTLEGKLKGVWFHVPNESVVGNFRDVIRIKRKHDMGLINGVADFVIVTSSKTMKFALMAFDAGTGLSEHAAPGDALIFALDGEGVIGYEGKEHVINAGENFRFARGGKHYVRADKRFKMALFLTLE